MEFPKTLTRLIGAALVGIPLFFVNPPKATGEELYFEGGIDSEFDIGATPSFQITNIPEYIRDVPKHPDDNYALDSNVAPISDDAITLSDSLRGRLEGKVGIGVKGNWYDFKLDARAGFTLDSASEIRERNYTNHPGTNLSGTGAALTYYRIFINEDISPLFGADAKFSVKLPKFNHSDETEWNCFVEYSADFFNKLYIENGWDRYGSLQVNDSYEIASIIDHIIKAGVTRVCLGKPLEFSSEFFAGVDFPQLIKTDAGSQIGITIYPSLIVGAKLSVGLNTKK